MDEMEVTNIINQKEWKISTSKKMDILGNFNKVMV